MSQGSLAQTAIRNPMIQKAIFQSLSGDDNSNHPDAITPEQADAQSELPGVDEEELKKIKQWAKNLKYVMIAISTFMTVTAFYNIGSSSNSSISTTFIALYVFFFSIMICCFELALKSAALYIVQNFGFMYSPWGRMMFIIFVSILCFSLSTFGIVCFCLLIIEMLVQIYVYIKHPQYTNYMKKLHYYDHVTPGVRVVIQRA